MHEFDLLLNKINDEFPICSIVTGHLIARCSSWWKNSFTNIAGQEIDSLTSSAGYIQIIDKPIHVVNNSICIEPYIFYKQKYNFKSWGRFYDFREMLT